MDAAADYFVTDYNCRISLVANHDLADLVIMSVAWVGCDSLWNVSLGSTSGLNIRAHFLGRTNFHVACSCCLPSPHPRWPPAWVGRLRVGPHKMLWRPFCDSSDVQTVDALTTGHISNFIPRGMLREYVGCVALVPACDSTTLVKVLGFWALVQVAKTAMQRRRLTTWNPETGNPSPSDTTSPAIHRAITYMALGSWLARRWCHR